MFARRGCAPRRQRRSFGLRRKKRPSCGAMTWATHKRRWPMHCGNMPARCHPRSAATGQKFCGWRRSCGISPRCARRCYTRSPRQIWPRGGIPGCSRCLDHLWCAKSICCAMCGRWHGTNGGGVARAHGPSSRCLRRALRARGARDGARCGCCCAGLACARALHRCGRRIRLHGPTLWRSTRPCVRAR